MLNYKQCEQLKDAGYSQTGLRYTWYYSTDPMGCYNSGEEYLDVKNHPDRIVLPTLSELMAAVFNYDKDDIVGDFTMIEDLGYWFVSVFSSKKGKIIKAKGKTPIEAVANLYIKLNKQL